MLEIIKLIISFLTPLMVLIIGLMINRKLEKNKLELSKEKEWQVKWAEIFFNHALNFNNNFSNAVYILFQLQNTEDNKNISVENLHKSLQEILIKLTEIDWNISVYARFANDNGECLLQIQKTLISNINIMIQAVYRGVPEKQNITLEQVRTELYNYNVAIRKAHSEILNKGI